ncbi:helix-turn-helix domain-containing protein [Candidatus Peregrinibacteria bacterium]|nr:helix-turn-helix domain-containing protein [Candidatus Peregrinibacteria bacterium]
MIKEFITIHEAAEISGKSVQTIRRALKTKKIKFRKKGTAQGFNYLISRNSILDFYKVKNSFMRHGADEVLNENQGKIPFEAGEADAIKNDVRNGVKNEKLIEEASVKASESFSVSTEDFKNFTKTLERMVTQHSEERQNFLRLVNTLQEKIFVLENQMNLLQSPKRRWYQLWK